MQALTTAPSPSHRYKAFLDKLTPTEYFEEQERLRQQRRVLRKEAKLAVRQEEVNIQFELDRAARLAAEAAEATKKGKKARSRKEKEEEEAARLAAEKAGTAPKLTLDDVSDDEEPEEEKEVPMYFKTPQQLLDIFTALEESNLFLIQNSQETEAALEELRTKFAETRTHMEAESESLKVQIDHLKSGIAVERDHSAVLAERAGRRGGVAEQEQTLEALALKVSEVYSAIFPEADASVSTLQVRSPLISLDCKCSPRRWVGSRRSRC